MVKEFETFHQWLQRGIEMTREITWLVRAESARYLGRCEKPTRRLLSATFDPATGPIVTYFIQTVHLMRRMRKVGYEYDADELAAFEQSSGLDLIISFAGILIFTGLTMYDAQKVKQMAAVEGNMDATAIRKVGILGALTLYLDFINLFLHILRFLGRKR